MPERITGTPLNDALNRPKQKLGMDWRLLAAFAAVSTMAAIFASLLLGVALFVALPAGARMFSKGIRSCCGCGLCRFCSERITIRENE